MPTSYYELLGVSSTASPDEIKSAFRREIARYHPDKLQHLGDEFQSMAAVRSAELTEAYKTLTDGTRRASYDAKVGSGDSAGEGPPDSSPQLESPTSVVRTGVGNLVKKAAVRRFREALHDEFGACEEGALPGFEIVCAPAKIRFWRALPPRMYVRFVQYVDGTAMTEAREMVVRVAHQDGREVYVFLMAPHVAPATELSAVTTTETRKSRSAGVTLAIVPVNTRTWSAHIPSGAPAAVRSLIARLKPS